MNGMLLAAAPVFLLILLGYGLTLRRMLGAGFWEGAERLTYYLLFPALLVSTLAGADFDRLPALPMAAALLGAIAAVTVLLLIARPLLRAGGPAFTSLLQGSIRMNTYIGLAVAFAATGPLGQASAAVAVAATVPFVNLISVVVLARHGARKSGKIRGALRQVAINPLILACALGIPLGLSGAGLPPVVDSLLAILGRGALPLGLLAVGAGLDFATLRHGGAALAIASALKLLVQPALAAGACALLGLSGEVALVAVLFAGLPTAASAYILARQMGGDAKLMASLITLQVALSAVTLPLVLTLLT